MKNYMTDVREMFGFWCDLAVYSFLICIAFLAYVKNCKVKKRWHIIMIVSLWLLFTVTGVLTLAQDAINNHMSVWYSFTHKNDYTPWWQEPLEK